jgi:biopolymer transport protein ExbD
MKNITLTIILSVLLLNISCDNIKTAVNTVTNNNAAKSKYTYAPHPQEIKNAKSDAHTADETAIILTSKGGNYYLGASPYTDSIRDIWVKDFKDLLGETPAERQLIYLNAEGDREFGDAVPIIHVIRKEKTENLGLIVSDTNIIRTVPPFHVLKVKTLPEPTDSPAEMEEWRKRTYLNMSKDGKLNFAKYDAKSYEFKLEKEEIKPEEIEAKVRQLLKEREAAGATDKRIYVKAARMKQYKQVVKMVDAATGAEVYLVIDDLEY